MMSSKSATIWIGSQGTTLFPFCISLCFVLLERKEGAGQIQPTSFLSLLHSQRRWLFATPSATITLRMSQLLGLREIAREAAASIDKRLLKLSMAGIHDLEDMVIRVALEPIDPVLDHIPPEHLPHDTLSRFRLVLLTLLSIRADRYDRPWLPSTDPKVIEFRRTKRPDTSYLQATGIVGFGLEGFSVFNEAMKYLSALLEAEDGHWPPR